MNLQINSTGTAPKYLQIADGITRLIEMGELNVGDKMPSIETISRTNHVAKETVVKAYRHLKVKGIIDSSEKKGFFVLTNNTRKQWRVLVLFNTLSRSKETIYRSIIQTLGKKADVDLVFHHNDLESFDNIIKSKATAYHYFIVMPHYSPKATSILKTIPPERLLILDRPLKQPIAGASSVHQDFKMDVYNVLKNEQATLAKYKNLIVLFPKHINLPEEIVEGIQQFAAEQKIKMKAVESPTAKMLVAGTLFITTTDDVLIDLIELQQGTKLKLGKDIGIISYNENPLKKILSGGISTISSDFEKMGHTVATLVLNKEQAVIHNSFNLIKRKSF